MSRTTFRLAAAAVSTVAIAALSIAPAMAADPAATGGPAAGNVALINKQATANLHITKYTGGEGTEHGTGEPIGGVAGRTPLAGVVFQAWPVTGVDLTTNAGWEAAVAYYNNIADAANHLGASAGTCTTEANGQCSLTGLPLGLYYVKEISAPASTGTSTTMAAPFLVTLPMTNPTSLNKWMYDVYVYPKNTQDTITKTVADKGTVTTEGGAYAYGSLGVHLITYTVTTSIGDGATPIDQYEIFDQLDSRLTPGTISLAFSDGTSIPASNYTVSTAGNLVHVTFNAAGLELLATNRALDVVTTIKTSMGAEAGVAPELDGIVVNSASFIPNKRWAEQHPGTNGIPSDKVVTKYGDLSIKKVDAKSGDPLSGAEFAVYRDDNAANGVCNGDDMTPAHLVIKSAGATQGDGTLTIKGLQTSNFYDNQVQTTLLQYCLVETKAPEGYNLLADPIAFTITDAGQTLAVTAIEVKNEKKNLDNHLPLTGGEGVAALSAAGLALIAGGLGYFAYTSRRRQES